MKSCQGSQIALINLPEIPSLSFLDKKTHKVWFDDMGKIVTNLPIKYIIPINYEKGVIMISYTDSKFAKYWFKKVADDTFEATLNKQLQQAKYLV